MNDTPPNTLATADIARVLKLLPHRYPFLMIDKIIDIDGDNSATGIKNVTINEPFFQGHFPNFPVMPGVMLVEGMAQTAGAICVAHLREDYQPQLVYFMAIDHAKFRKPVMPGDTVHFHVKKIRNRGPVWRFSCEAKVEGHLVAEAEISAMIVDPTKPPGGEKQLGCHPPLPSACHPLPAPSFIPPP
jgi:3-hydroxyacyl-[acyl-carrier-protein] dehydratase